MEEKAMHGLTEAGPTRRQHPLDPSVLTDLFVYSMGHEIAAIRLSSEAVARCTDSDGRMLLVDLTLARLDELRRFSIETGTPQLPSSRTGVSIDLQGLAPDWPDPGRRLPPARAALRGYRQAASLLGAVRAFDEQAWRLLDRISRLLPDPAAQEIVGILRDAKRRWIALYDDVRQVLAVR
jgi:hypothetical protein